MFIFVHSNQSDDQLAYMFYMTNKYLCFSINNSTIMKKLLSLLMAAMLLPMALNAQLLGNQNLKMQHAPYALKSFSPRMMAPALNDLGEGQKILGHYDTDDLTTDGLGITGLPGVIPISTILTPDELALFQGGKIVKFRVGLAQSTPVTRVFVAPVTGNTIGQFTEWTCNVSAVGWNEVTLETPFDINFDSSTSLMIGFDYKQTNSNYPISAVTVGDIYPSYILYQGSWQDVGLSDYGNLSLQCVVESEFFADYMISVGGLTVKSYTKLGNDLEFAFNTRNTGVATAPIAAGACTYNVLIDDAVVATITNPEAFGNSWLNIPGTLPTTGLAPGRHVLSVQVISLNGEPVEQPFMISREFVIYENGFERQMHLVEQFTAIGCTHCPKGTHMLQLLTQMRDDIAWVAIHQNFNGTDPMRTTQCDTINNYQGNSSFPSASFDRSVGWEDDVAISNSIGYYAQYHQQVAEELSNFFDYLAEAPSFATVNINSTLDPETRQAVVTVSGELTPDFDMMLGADSKLTVYITEDGIVNRQLNDGVWESNYVHNGVMRRALGTALGNTINRDGNTYENTYTYTIPNNWNIDNLNVVAFISRPLANGVTGVYTDMFVNQANKRKLGEFDEPEVILGDVNGDEVVDISDVTALIASVLSGNAPANIAGADVNFDGELNVADVTKLITFLLSGNW